MKIEFTNPTIDLVRTYNMYEKNSEDNKDWSHSFGFPVVNLAMGVISGWPYEENLFGIRDCLEWKIKKLSRTDYFLKIPTGKTNIGEDIKSNNQQRLIADSLILSIIEFYDHLNEHGTGLASNTKIGLRRGFELACLWGKGTNLDPEKNDWVVVRDNEKFLKYITNENERKYGRNGTN